MGASLASDTTLQRLGDATLQSLFYSCDKKNGWKGEAKGSKHPKYIFFSEAQKMTPIYVEPRNLCEKKQCVGGGEGIRQPPNLFFVKDEIFIFNQFL